ncbi:TIGR02680 family protein [Pseudactinotalea sp. HY160]|uniref:TIGR02680 family protein n=1 Tax=Pseudactinotalea sp. HY160 TaxID=2654490 RepID=UPI00128D8D55|nr:TIGR02680 family protein [Pseudactinotalea sp. HY160]MPV50648.1 TIGR02680 family protein [Pseudactinotalea sp. HY160]
MTAPTHTDTAALPRPTSERWQPLRLGLVDLFYYDDEQFWFHDGRLLLRGNNGTGKSKVLALTLPFLLDGSIAPRRVEPDADPKKRMDWNLLLGGAHPHTERTGYSWVEFGRVDAAGTEHFTTLGIGLKAAAGRGIVKTWYFTSTRRIGDLRLLDEHRTALSAERLRDDLAGSGAGHVHTTQEAYRRAVDEAMFRLGPERYSALIDLLIQLRQPQLSKRPDEKALSAALTEALTPLDQAVVADVAESFRSLEDERSGVAEAKETLRAAEAFLRHYRAYARVASRRRTTAVRAANSTYEQAGRDLREAEDSLAAATGEVERLARHKQVQEEEQGSLQGQERALRESPEMRDAARLEDAERSAREAEDLEAAAAQEQRRAAASAEEQAREADEAAAQRDEAATGAHRQAAEAASLAAAAGLAPEHPRLLDDAAAAGRALDRRRDQVRHVEALVAAAARARGQAEQERRALDAAQSAFAGRTEELHTAREAVQAAVAGYREAVRGHLRGLRSLDLAGSIDEIVEAAEAWARTLTGDAPARSAIAAAATDALGRIGRERATADHEAGVLAGELAQRRAEIAELESGRDPEPPPAPGRDEAARVGRAGAPLWRLTDVAGGVSEGERAGIEAALQSAGLLDAWVLPDGTLEAAGDVVLGPAGPAVADSLASVLVPTPGPDETVGAEAIGAVLARIGRGADSGAAWWVDTGGHWGAGPARGSWTKPRAEYLGAGARAAHRRALLEDLRARVELLEENLRAARAAVAAADAAAAEVQRERAGYPEILERELSAEHARSARAQQEADRAEAATHAAETTWQRADDEATWAQTELTDQAGELGLGTTSTEIDAAREAVHAYRAALERARSAVHALTAATTALGRATARSEEARELLASREADHRQRRARATGLRSTFEELHATVGASVAELQARLGEATAALDRVAESLARTARDQLGAASTQGRLTETVQELQRRRDESDQARADSIEELRLFAGTGLLRVALPEEPVPDGPEAWNLTATLALARSVEQQLGDDESPDAWARAQQRVSGAATDLSAQMSRHGHTAFVEQHGDVLVVRVRYLNEEVDIDRLALRLAQDVADRERLLSAREREILENHLVSEVAGHLHELLLTAEGQIDRMNRELAARKTSTGMQLRVRWRERGDGPAGLAAARGLMVRSDASWTAQDRAAIGDFLQAQIAEVRQADPTGSWQEHLERALDYRQWHTFVVERWQSGQWRSASGPASGGERALAVSVPLFAAASAHYNSAGPHAPRLILLDEAFAGVDDDSRAKSLGLLATFDLDVVMTSEREWGCYPQVPGLSIAQLSRVEGIDAVGVTRWRWDGRRRERDAEVAAAARAGGETIAADDATLFG